SPSRPAGRSAARLRLAVAAARWRSGGALPTTSKIGRTLRPIPPRGAPHNSQWWIAPALEFWKAAPGPLPRPDPWLRPECRYRCRRSAGGGLPWESNEQSSSRSVAPGGVVPADHLGGGIGAGLRVLHQRRYRAP